MPHLRRSTADVLCSPCSSDPLVFQFAWEKPTVSQLSDSSEEALLNSQVVRYRRQRDRDQSAQSASKAGFVFRAFWNIHVS